MLEAINNDVPEFGGLFRDSTGAFVVHLTDLSRAANAANVIRVALRDASRRGLKEFGSVGDAQLRFVLAAYTFKQLADWRRSLYTRGIPDGTIMSGIDKRTNRLLIAVASVAGKAAWVRVVADARVPLEAVRYQEMEVPMPRDGVQDRIRPTVGGIQISIAPSFGLCTLGANVRYAPDTAGRYFITASHCSTKMWDLDGGSDTTKWYQSHFVVEDLIATGEAADPLPFSGGACPAGRVCRYGDVTLVKYSAPSAWELGFVAVAPGGQPGPNYAITNHRSYIDQPFCCFFEFPTVGKTGRTTGSTVGAIQWYCMDFHPNQQTYANAGVTIGPNWTMLCQNWGSNWIHAGGDSGSPVYAQYNHMVPNNEVFIDGIFHAGNSQNFIYSPFANFAEYDFGVGNLSIHDNGFWWEN